MAMSREELEYQALDFIHFHWKKTSNPEARRKFDEGLRKLNVTEADFLTKIAAFDGARKLLREMGDRDA